MHQVLAEDPWRGWRGAGKMGTKMEQTFHNLNLRTVTLQGESYLKKREKMLDGFSGILFSVYNKP